jgi:hypothetical protein
MVEGSDSTCQGRNHDTTANHCWWNLKDKAQFEKEYRFTLETCYACHKASDKPFIRLQMPTQPETPIINFDPKADWPQ